MAAEFGFAGFPVRAMPAGAEVGSAVRQVEAFVHGLVDHGIDGLRVAVIRFLQAGLELHVCRRAGLGEVVEAQVPFCEGVYRGDCLRAWNPTGVREVAAAGADSAWADKLPAREIQQDAEFGLFELGGEVREGLEGLRAASYDSWSVSFR